MTTAVRLRVEKLERIGEEVKSTFVYRLVARYELVSCSRLYLFGYRHFLSLKGRFSGFGRDLPVIVPSARSAV